MFLKAEEGYKRNIKDLELDLKNAKLQSELKIDKLERELR